MMPDPNCPYHSQYSNEDNLQRSKLKQMLFKACTCKKGESDE